MADSGAGFKKVGHKKRRGRKRNPQPHKKHRKPGTPRDPVTKAMIREHKRQQREREDA